MSALQFTYNVNETTRLSMVVFTNEKGARKTAVGIKRLVGSKWSLDHSTCEEFFHSAKDGDCFPYAATSYASDLLAKEYGGFAKVPTRFFRDNLLRG